MKIVVLRKGAASRELILAHAHTLASEKGLDSLTIGSLASASGMSKSGVFAHFGSREELQLAVLDFGALEFTEEVILPALKEPRGLPRLLEVIKRWQARFRRLGDQSGCLLVSAMVEFDDRPGVIRDRAMHHQRRLREEIAFCANLAVQAGHLAAGCDCAQLAFELFALTLAVQHDVKLYGVEPTLARGERAYTRLIQNYR